MMKKQESINQLIVEANKFFAMGYRHGYRLAEFRYPKSNFYQLGYALMFLGGFMLGTVLTTIILGQ
jgi:hypothetical protein